MFAGVMRRAAVLALAAGLSGCTPLGLNTASNRLDGMEPARPAVLDAFGEDRPVLSAADWTQRRAPLLRRAFEDQLYGPVPAGVKAHEVSRRIIDAAFAEGAGTLEEIEIAIGDGDAGPRFRLALALPKPLADVDRPPRAAPLLLSESFCGNPGHMGAPGLAPPRGDGGCENTGFMARVIRLIFGVHIIEAPVADILARGYAYASLYPSEIVGDNAERAQADLAALAPALAGSPAPTSALAVWAAAYSWALDVLEADPRIDASRTAIYGHSRHGKAALISAAFEPRVEAAIIHQSGKGGATLTRSYAGESVAQITRSYPHWFAPAYAAYADNEAAIPVDQHQLIALAAPRPLFVSNGWKDVWSDPNGSFRALQGADPVWRLLGAEGLTQADLREPVSGGVLEFFIREGGHGVRSADWAAFLDFLDRRL